MLLYQYFNPPLFTVLTVSPTTNMCGLYLVDSTEGTLVPCYITSRSRVMEVVISKMALTEYWLVYHYFEGEVADGSVGKANGHC